MNKDRMYWWHAADLRPVLLKLGFTQQAISEADLRGKRLELHLDDKLLYVRGENAVMTLDAATADGDDFIHTCPPECPS